MGLLMISRGVGGHIGFKKAMNEIFAHPPKISSYAYT